MSWRVTNTCFLVVLLWMFLAGSASAQESVNFDARRAHLLEVAEQRLSEIRSVALRSTLSSEETGATFAREKLTLGEFGGADLGRVNETRARLRTLGVDAAQVFAEHGVPLELLAVAEVESGINPLAISPKGARGLWQLMPATAERFGLRVDSQIDQRVQAMHSTRAAAKYLRELKAEFGNWLLALAAYNAGEARVRRAIETSGEKDFWRLAQRGLLPAETAAFVPAVLRAMGGEGSRTQQ